MTLLWKIEPLFLINLHHHRDPHPTNSNKQFILETAHTGPKFLQKDVGSRCIYPQQF